MRVFLSILTGKNLKQNGRNTTVVTGGNLGSLDTCQRTGLNIPAYSV